jgi:hypothetical protein
LDDYSPTPSEVSIVGKNFPKRITDILISWYAENITYPFPTEWVKQELNAQTGLSVKKINTWFINGLHYFANRSPYSKQEQGKEAWQ